MHKGDHQQQNEETSTNAVAHRSVYQSTTSCSSSMFDEEDTISIHDIFSLERGHFPHNTGNSSHPSAMLTDTGSVSTASTRSFFDDEQSWKYERANAFYDAYMKGDGNLKGKNIDTIESKTKATCTSPVMEEEEEEESSSNDSDISVCDNHKNKSEITASPPTPLARNDSEGLFRPKGRRFLERNRSFRDNYSRRSSLSLNSLLCDLDTTSYRSSKTEHNNKHEDTQTNFTKQGFCGAKSESNIADDEDHQCQQQHLHMVEIIPGLSVPLRGSAETRKAVQNDFFAPLLCQGCSAEYLCIADASYALCPYCQIMNPMMDNIFEGRSLNKRYGLGLGFTYEALFDLSSELLASHND